MVVSSEGIVYAVIGDSMRDGILQNFETEELFDTFGQVVYELLGLENALNNSGDSAGFLPHQLSSAGDVSTTDIDVSLNCNANDSENIFINIVNISGWIGSTDTLTASFA